MDSYDILVILLSVTLFVLLVLTIVLVVNLIKITKAIRHVTDKAASIVDSVEAAGHVMRNAAESASVGKSVVNIIDTIMAKTSDKRGKK